MIRVGQVVCWQLALVAVGAAAGATRPVLITTTALSITLILLTGVKWNGVWLYQWTWYAARWSFRRRRASLPEATDLVGHLCGRTTSSSVVVRDHPVGLLSRPDGVSAVLRLSAAWNHERLLTELLAAADDQPAPIRFQVIFHSGTRRDGVTRAWIAVCARRTPDLAADEQLAKVLANTLRRVLRRLDRQNVPAVPLDQGALLTTMTAIAHANGGRDQLRERWSRCANGPVRQAAVRLKGFTRLPNPVRDRLVASLLDHECGGALTFAIAATRGAEEPYLRVAAQGDSMLDNAVARLTALIEPFGVTTERLNGRHAAGLTATLPLGVL